MTARESDATGGPSPPLVVCDFDGTLTTLDVGHALYERFAEPAWRDIEARWRRGEIAMDVAQAGLVGLLRGRPDELRAHALAVGRFRAGAEALFAAAASGRIELVVVSAGFDFYIRPLLAAIAASPKLHCNDIEWLDPGYRVVFGHPHLACAEHSPCKGRLVEQAVHRGRRVAFCGDGLADRCATTTGAVVYAVESSDLAAWCLAHGVAHRPFERLDAALDDL